MTRRRCNRRGFENLRGACIAGIVNRPWLGSAMAAPAQKAAGTPQDPDLVVLNARVDALTWRSSHTRHFRYHVSIVSVDKRVHLGTKPPNFKGESQRCFVCEG